MEYMTFLESVCDYINETADSVSVSIHKAVKNNGVILSGLTFSREGYNASPTIYMENYYEKYKNGCDICDIGDELIELYTENDMAASLDMSFFDDFSRVRRRLYIKLINKKKNEEFLKEAPFEEFLDLAIVAYVRINDKKIGNGIIMVKNEHLKLWNKDAKTVIDIAKKNTHDHDGFNLRHIVDVLGTMSGLLSAEPSKEDFPMYVATNRRMICGACVLTMKDKLKEYSDVIGGDYYVIPSSVNELILLGCNTDSDTDNINVMIREVNSTQLCPDEVLSDHAYRYLQSDEVLIF